MFLTSRQARRCRSTHQKVRISSMTPPFVRRSSLPASLGVFLLTALLVGGTFGPLHPAGTPHRHFPNGIAPHRLTHPKSSKPLPTPPRSPEHPLSSSTIAAVYAATVPVTRSLQSIDHATSATALRQAWSQYQKTTRHLHQVVQQAMRPIPFIAPHLTHVPVPARPTPKGGAHHSTAQTSAH